MNFEPLCEEVWDIYLDVENYVIAQTVYFIRADVGDNLDNEWLASAEFTIENHVRVYVIEDPSLYSTGQYAEVYGTIV